MARDYTAVPWEYLDEMEELTDEEFGRLIRALLLYSQSGEIISPSGNERFYIRRVINREDRYRENFEEQSAALSERGKAGANARWANAKASKSMLKHAKASQAMQDDAKHGNTDSDTDTETNTNNTPLTPQGAEGSKGFDQFWAVYPKKVGKQAALKAFQRIKGVSVETLIHAVEYQRSTAQWQKNNGQFIPNPATWLNQGRWEDEVEVKQQQTQYADRGDLDALMEKMGVEYA